MNRPASLPVFLAALFAAAALLALPAAASAEPSPWWQLLPGSRPTNLQPAPTDTEVQEASTTASSGAFAARVEVAGEVLGCLGTGELSAIKQSADQLCEALTGGLFTASQTAPELKAMLEAAYGAGEVEVTGGPVGGEPFLITTGGRWVPPVRLTPFSLGPLTAGKASVTPTSQGSGRLVITATNLGDAPLDAESVPLTLTDTLPDGVQAYGAEAFAGGQGTAGPVDCVLPSTQEVRCTFEGSLPSYEALELEVPVALKSGTSSTAGHFSLSGGEGPDHRPVADVSASQPIHVSSEPVPFGLEYFLATAEEEGGGEATQAGAHPFQWTNTVQFNSGSLHGGPDRRSITVDQPALPRNTGVTFPAGLVGSATAVQPCSMSDFLTTTEVYNHCPDSAAVGAASVTIIERNAFGLVRLAVPIFALEPARGEPARFGFMPVGVPVLIDTSVDPSDSYRINGVVRNAPQAAQVLSATITIWGVPGDPRHDPSRGQGCLIYTHKLPCEALPAGRDQTPLLRMPVSCSEPLLYEGLAEPWNAPPGTGAFPALETPALRGCSRVPFDPSISNALTSKLAANPSGLDLGIRMPNKGLENPEAEAAEAQFKRAEVTLPRGVTINPSQAEGLIACSEADYARERYDSAPGEGCPEASKIGSVQISTPLLEEEAQGAVYVATPYENPTHSLIGLYLVARIPERGILVKQPIEVRPDPVTGQLVSVATDVPQLPFSSFDFHFREGGRSPLVTPPGCGSFQTVARFTPWSAADPDNPAPSEVVERTATFTIERGVTGGACPSGPAPFAPGFEASSVNDQAGAYTPFQMRLTRNDGEQDMGRFSFKLPPGVVPRLAGIPYCSEADIAQAQSRQGPHGGQEEKDSPSCPAASQIGRTEAGAGVGNQLTYVPGALYLAGPYHGDPISAVSITPAVAGPFDAGTVVVREALRLNPVTHIGEVDGAASDPIPHILKGIPLNLRDLRVYADKDRFTLNATSCDPFEASATIWGDGTALEPLSPSPVTLSSRYQAAGCASLGFKPKLNLKLKGGTRRGAFPALRAAYVPRKHNQANLSRLALTFPHSEFIEQGHFRTICTRVQFAAGGGFGEKCPKGSIYGHAKAWTPLLDEPLQGPVYLRSSNHNLPDAVLALHGLVDIEVATRIDSVHGRLRAIVADVPDAPVSRAVVRMQGGQKGLFVNSRNLCHKAGRNRARVDAKGQNNRRRLFKPLMRAPGCAKAKHRRHRHHRHKG